jgi:cell division protein FtsB
MSESESAPGVRPAPTPAKDARGPRPNRIRRLVRYALLFVTIVLFVDAIVGERGLLALVDARRQFAAVEQALESARGDNAALREEARRLREDPTAIEALARRDLGLIKPGERLFIVKDITKK